MKKLLSVLLLLAMLLSAFAACKTQAPKAEEASQEESEETPPDLLLFSEGKTDFSIVYNEMEMAKNPNVEAKFKELESNFQKYTGVKLKKTASMK